MFSKVLIIAFVFVGLASSETYDKVNLTLIYQARCSVSRKFITGQFYTGYKQLSDYINLELIPYTGPNDDGSVDCQHGENECFISKAQACVYEQPGVTDANRVEFLHCTEAYIKKRKDVVDAEIKTCVDTVLADLVTYETVQTCMTGIKSYSLLKSHEGRENQYHVKFVPWVAFFGVYDGPKDDAVEKDFVGTICKMLSNPPDVCNS